MVNLCSAEAMDGAKPVLLMIVVQSLFAAVSIMLKMVANDGTSISVLNAYRFLFSAAFMVPIAFLFERKSVQGLTGKVLFQTFFCGLFGGSLIQNLYVKSLALVSPTYTITMLNLNPAITYIMAFSLGLEKPILGTQAGKAKLLGTLMGVGGAMILTLYEGRRLFNFSTHINLLKHAESPPHGAAAGSRVLGLMLGLCASLCYSLFLIVQTKTSEKFPWPYSVVALTSTMSAIQSIVFALCVERDWSQWKLGWDFKLLTTASSGILASGVCFGFIACCVRLKGPLFVSAFSPIMLVLAALGGFIVLDDYITIGSLIGALLIVFGLYILLWGKRKEKEMAESEMVSAKGSVQCDSIYIANSSLACNEREHDKKMAESVAPVASTSVNNSLGDVQQLKI